MADIQDLFEQVDALSPDEIKQLYDYIVTKHVEFVPTKAVEAPTGKRILGLHAHLGPHWMSDDFDDDLLILGRN